MWKRVSLRTRILLTLTILVVTTIGGGIVSIGYTYMMDHFFGQLIETDVEALQAAQELENAIVMQKGFVSYYFQDGDPEWLIQLQAYNKLFESWLSRARQWAVTDQERALLNEIDAQYIRYIQSREQVIALYQSGKKEEGFRLHKAARGQFFSIISLTQEFKRTHEQRIVEGRAAIRARADLINVLALVALTITVILGGLLGYILIKQVLIPIRELTLKTGSPDSDGENPPVQNEVKALSERFQDLIEDVDQTKSKLKWSREHLLQAEKWALVGKLAAGVAHSVRNPLTSVKMRLFSMERSLALTPSQKEDFEVISEEIRHIDAIVGNFLEFSRPPKLKMQKISPSDCVDIAVQLLRHRLESYDVKVEVNRSQRLNEVMCDPDQIKEVIVNIIVNACEAMVDGGLISIEEESLVCENIGHAVSIKITDSGPGIPESIQEKLFQPFYSTKEEGTGLGLSIATRIVEEHGGRLGLNSQEGKGATFIINLPERTA